MSTSSPNAKRDGGPIDMAMMDRSYDTLLELFPSSLVTNVVSIFGAPKVGKTKLVEDALRLPLIHRNSIREGPSQFLRDEKAKEGDRLRVAPHLGYIKPITRTMYADMLRSYGSGKGTTAGDVIANGSCSSDLQPTHTFCPDGRWQQQWAIDRRRCSSFVPVEVFSDIARRVGFEQLIPHAFANGCNQPSSLLSSPPFAPAPPPLLSTTSITLVDAEACLEAHVTSSAACAMDFGALNTHRNALIARRHKLLSTAILEYNCGYHVVASSSSSLGGDQTVFESHNPLAVSVMNASQRVYYVAKNKAVNGKEREEERGNSYFVKWFKAVKRDAFFGGRDADAMSFDGRQQRYVNVSASTDPSMWNTFAVFLSNMNVSSDPQASSASLSSSSTARIVSDCESAKALACEIYQTPPTRGPNGTEIIDSATRNHSSPLAATQWFNSLFFHRPIVLSCEGIGSNAENSASPSFNGSVGGGTANGVTFVPPRARGDFALNHIFTPMPLQPPRPIEVGAVADASWNNGNNFSVATLAATHAANSNQDVTRTSPPTLCDTVRGLYLTLLKRRIASQPPPQAMDRSLLSGSVPQFVNTDLEDANEERTVAAIGVAHKCNGF